MILVNIDGRAAAVGRLQRGDDHAVQLHILTPLALALVIVFVLIQAFGANPCSR
jgi:hypothetical protein